MATKYSEIYNRAMFRFSDYGFLDIYADKRDVIMRNFLMQAQVDFQHACIVDLNDYDDEQEQFNNTLGNEEQEILALGFAYHWLSQRALNSELLHNTMTRKDYNTYSPANLLKEIVSLRDAVRLEYQGKINEYSFRHSDLDKLKTGGDSNE